MDTPGKAIDVCAGTTVCMFLCSLAVTKIDILDTFEELKIGIGYKVDGKKLPLFPGKRNVFAIEVAL